MVNYTPVLSLKQGNLSRLPNLVENLSLRLTNSQGQFNFGEARKANVRSAIITIFAPDQQPVRADFKLLEYQNKCLLTLLKQKKRGATPLSLPEKTLRLKLPVHPWSALIDLSIKQVRVYLLLSYPNGYQLRFRMKPSGLRSNR